MDSFIERSPDPKLWEKIKPDDRTGDTLVPVTMWQNVTPIEMWSLSLDADGYKEWRGLYTEVARTLFGEPDARWEGYSYFKFTASRADLVLEFILQTTPVETRIGNALELMGGKEGASDSRVVKFSFPAEIIAMVPDILHWLSAKAIQHYGGVL